MSTAHVDVSTSAMLSSLINPAFRGLPDASAVARYLINAMVSIKKYDLPMRIYVTREVTEKIGGILAAMGVRFKLIPTDKMDPPYIFIYQSDTYFVIKTVDEGGREVAEFSVPIAKFVEELQSYLSKGRGKPKRSKVEEVNALIIGDEFTEFVKRVGDLHRDDKGRGADDTRPK